ncbi:MAG: ribonuclease HII [Ottowia sp.]|nr:ribonuclease HII [Halieaceae bacterium]MCB2068695.1 ribonuclease HII [Ottowia sp.]MCP5148167.1 ribonuclease HII [Pseudomonadales bacterium]MCP5167222.1 ribonuclease HII [Pseudomonadales bacterium]MCP5187697.1 ribonuclease HII [Pseudomonadales bacterium]
MDDLFRPDYDGPGVAGVDEVGRGPLAGDVVAAAVILDPARPVSGLRDSKQLSAARREQLAAQIREQALAWSVARATVAEIDELNILQASLLAMHRAVRALQPQPVYVLVDGNRLPRWDYASEPVVKGDDRVAAIAAASILAKVQRDAELLELDRQYPGYGFARHKGYPTPAHLAALRELGATAVHRRSFAPVRAILQAE